MVIVVWFSSAYAIVKSFAGGEKPHTTFTIGALRPAGNCQTALNCQKEFVLTIPLLAR